MLRHITGDQNLTNLSYHNLGPQTVSLAVLAKLGIEGGSKAVFTIPEQPCKDLLKAIKESEGPAKTIGFEETKQPGKK